MNQKEIIMRLSTSTNIMDRLNGVQNHVTIEECIKACAKAGYKVLDMNFCDMSNEGMPLTFDDWEEWLDEIIVLSKELGIEFSQSHSAFYNVCDKNTGDIPWREELVRRAIVGSAKIGVKWVVLHAGTVYDSVGYSREKSLHCNLEYFSSHLQLAKKHDIGLAIENSVDNFRNGIRQYCGDVDELIELVDSFNDNSVGICWDFGHGNLMRVNQVEALKRMGKRLCATHVADNLGEHDDHTAPFFGEIDWITIMKTLKEIGYNYDFTYEAHNYTGRVPLPLREPLLKHTVEIGEYLLSFAK